jgi:protein tyrosine phosphatase
MEAASSGAPKPPDVVCFYRFWHAVRSFLDGHARDVVIAVHCTHGCNKTGAMLVALYMVAHGKTSLQAGFF